MKRQLDQKQKMYNAVLKFFDTEFPADGKIPEVLSASVEELRAAAGNFHDKAVSTKVSRKGGTSDKIQNRSLICREGALLSRMLRAVARKTTNAGLYENSRFTMTTLGRLKETNLHYQCLEIYKLAISHQDDLAKLGINAALMETIGGHFQSFGEQIIQTRMAVIESAGLTNSMSAIHGDAAMILRNQIAPLMEVLKENHPQWVASYRLATKVVAQTGSRAQIRGEIIVVGTQKGLVGATIAIKDSNESRVSGKGGRFYFRRIQPGTYNIIISRPGFQSREMQDLVVLPGQTVKVSITLDKEIQAEAKASFLPVTPTTVESSALV